MTKGDICNLIVSHFDGDSRLFFSTCLKILREFKDDGDTALAGRLDTILKSHAMIAPKREEPKPMDMPFEHAESLGWVPMGESNG